MLACAALVGAMFMLMGAGYRVVTTYMSYILGQGVVTQELEDVYTLARTARIGSFDRIDALSMVPADEGEYAGKWKVSVMTSRTLSAINEQALMHIRKPDGTEYELLYSELSNGYSCFTGYMDNAGAGTYTIVWGTDEAAVEMVPMTNSKYAVYDYPVSDGISVICFPLAEGSDKLVMSCTLTPDSDHMKYWMEQSSYVSLNPWNITVTDAEGNTYSTSWLGITYRSSAADTDGSPSCTMESIYQLSEYPTASIAKVQISEVQVYLGLEDMPACTLTIPAEGETVSLENRMLVDTHGLRLVMEEIAAGTKKLYYYDKELPVVSLKTACPQIDFPENVTYADFTITCRIPDDPDKLQYASTSLEISVDGEELLPSDWKERSPKYKHFYLLGEYKDAVIQNRGIPAENGDSLLFYPQTLELTVSGNWLIDFTAEDTGIPQEAIKYGK